MAGVSGNNQQGLANAPLSAPIVVRVTDQYSNNVSGTMVTFIVTSGGGSVNPAQSVTSSNGQAQTSWTLGGGTGTQTLEARANSLSGPPLTGSPTGFSATASTLLLTAVTPDTLVEGQGATLTGGGFSTTPANNVVIVGGLTATVTSATSTSLVITVPTSNCQPARDAGVNVTVSSVTSNTITKRVHPASFVNLAVGQQTIVQDPTQFCLQFRPSATGGDAYLVGLGAAAETPTAVLLFTMTSAAGVSATAMAVSAAPLLLPTTRGASYVAPSAELVAGQLSQLRAEAKLRGWERQHLNVAGAARGAIAGVHLGERVVTAVPNAGDTIRFKVPASSSPCTNFTSILTRVRVVGSAGIWVTDTANPKTSDSLSLADIQAASNAFDGQIYATDTLFFGKPSDIDGNQRVFVVLTKQVNNQPFVLGFVFAGDLFPTSSCPQSNGGEIFYGQVPDPNNTSGTGARSKAFVLSTMPTLIAHEFTHIIQDGRRIFSGDPSATFLSVWEAEGQATLAVEVVGRDVNGNPPGQNNGSAIAFGPGSLSQWYQDEFEKLFHYYGLLDTSSTITQAAGAPELCTLFGSSQLVGPPCFIDYFYGASWSFQRYVVDRFGGTYPGGPTQLTRDWIGKSPGLAGSQNVAALLGVNLDTLFDQWAAMLYVDDLATGNPALTMTSWNLANIYIAVIPQTRLTPASRTFSAFQDSRSVRYGSTAYTVLSASGAHPALALRVRGAGDATVGTSAKPQLWIVRLQ